MTNQLNMNVEDVDYILLIDLSGSMEAGSGKLQGSTFSGKQRFQKGRESVAAFAAKIQSWDDDGLTVAFFNQLFTVEDGVTAERVDEVFARYKPNGGTLLAPVLQDLVDRFIPGKPKGKKLFGLGAVEYEQITPLKPVLFFIYTDGCPGDEDKALAVIKDATRRTQRGNLAFLFVQVGQDSDAENFLNRADTKLKGAAYDAVGRTHLDRLELFTTKEIVEKAFNGETF